MAKKMVLVAVLVMISAGGLFALDWQAFPDPIKPGNFMINAGIGFGAPLQGSMVIPPLTASVDYAMPVGLPFTVGALVGFTTSEDTYTAGPYGYTADYTGFAMAGRFGYHPDLGVKNLNVSATIALGYYLYTAKASYNDWPDALAKIKPKDYSQFYLGLNIGGRYFFTNNVGAFLDLGYSALTFVTAGVTFKF
jgi:hypothetical protein